MIRKKKDVSCGLQPDIQFGLSSAYNLVVAQFIFSGANTSFYFAQNSNFFACLYRLVPRVSLENRDLENEVMASLNV